MLKPFPLNSNMHSLRICDLLVTNQLIISTPKSRDTSSTHILCSYIKCHPQTQLTQITGRCIKNFVVCKSECVAGLCFELLSYRPQLDALTHRPNTHFPRLIPPCCVGWFALPINWKSCVTTSKPSHMVAHLSCLQSSNWCGHFPIFVYTAAARREHALALTTTQYVAHNNESFCLPSSRINNSTCKSTLDTTCDHFRLPTAVAVLCGGGPALLQHLGRRLCWSGWCACGKHNQPGFKFRAEVTIHHP